MSFALFADLKCYLPGDEIPPPQTAVNLLMRLHCVTKPLESQQAGITKWLATNEASEALLRDLRHRGFTV